eukprot:3020629-Pleurochrysis_carterae.AAC.4
MQHPEHVDEKRMFATCPYHLAEVAQFNWLSEVDWMSGVPTIQMRSPAIEPRQGVTYTAR